MEYKVSVIELNQMDLADLYMTNLMAYINIQNEYAEYNKYNQK